MGAVAAANLRPGDCVALAPDVSQVVASVDPVDPLPMLDDPVRVTWVDGSWMCCEATLACERIPAPFNSNALDTS